MRKKVFVIIGQNERIAWGFTNTGSDVSDLFIEKTDPDDAAKYLTPDGSRHTPYQNQQSVVVTDVMPASVAEDVGFMRGDLIVEMNHVALHSQSQYSQALAGLKPGQEVVFKVMRRGGDNDHLLTIFLAGVIPTP